MGSICAAGKKPLLWAVPLVILTKLLYSLTVAIAKTHLLISPHLKFATLSIWHHSIEKKKKDSQIYP